MANLEEVFASEWDRENPSEWNKIHLYKMGDFWRAYEWSAWIISVITFSDNVRMGARNRKPLHVTRMVRADVEGTYCFVGFPIKSVEKYIPERENFESVDDKHVVITIVMPSDGTEITFDRLSEEVRKWKETIEITERKPKKDKMVKEIPVVDAGLRPAGGGILAQILSYPLAERTAVENIRFIESLKGQITAIL
ncbi:MAG: hypothetical protein IKV77_12990 [Alistipes sp.]|nr:hypothetical protein [Bacteroidales bacterium]MBR5492515.1 hypothetical protein [Alistipes sp.]MBR5494022.1 hypothetical protein [Alistipes sp.]MBR5920084.1 hypothetical protein [Bacteroidales bacterium]